jgi:para-aminobenzoate synthetase component 1
MTLDSGRKEVFCAHPLEVISLQAADNAGTLRSQLKAALQRLPQSPHLKDLSFRGGLAGFLGYDLVAKDHAPDFPRAWMGLYSSFLYIDHNKKTAEVIELPGFSDIAYKWKDLLRELNDGYAPPSLPSFSLTSPFIALTSADRYRQDFARIQQYLQDGDCYQVNYAQAFRASARGSSASAMQRLLEISRPSHAAWLSLPEGDVLSLSPELFLKVEQGRITTKPIKGTAPRSADPVTDEETARALQASPKNRAENLMIVDLLRHDLSRHAETGSVRVEKLFEIESLPQVHHLVSTIIGNIKKESHVIDLIMDSFPGGSITGAPKKRAMEIIAELEPTPRSVYCGSIGFINGDGDCELNIAIRTLLRLGDDIYTWAGGGIVADSACEAEYQECFDKIGALMRTLEGMGQD